METSVNNKCRAFTSLEQSKKLSEILPIESADMCWVTDEIEPLWGVVKSEPDDDFDVIPCWSLAALLDQLEDTIYDEDGYEYELVIKKESVQYDIYYLTVYGEQENIELDHFYDDLIDCCFQMILKLKEKDLL